MLNILKSILISVRGTIVAGMIATAMIFTHLSMLKGAMLAHIILNEWIGLWIRVTIILLLGFFIDYIFKIKVENERYKEVYASLFEHNLDASYSFDILGHFKEVNKATSQITGYSKEELLNKSFIPLIADEEKEKVLSYFKRVINGESVIFDSVILHKSGDKRIINLMAVPIFVHNHIVGCIGVGRDITEKLETENQLKESEERYRSLMKLQPEMVCVISESGIEYINQRGIEFLGMNSPKDVLGKSPLQYVAEDDRETLKNNFTKLLKGANLDLLHEYRFINYHGEIRIGEVSSARINYKGKPCVMGIVRDITEKRQAEDKLKRANQLLESLSSKDGLTNIYNRRYFEQKYKEEWEESAKLNKPMSLILLDIDCFKQYNDTYGHLAGDQCLISVSHEIENTIKNQSYTFARYGGEEFIILLPMTPLNIAVEVAEQLRKNIRSLNIEHKTSDVSPNITISLGVAQVEPARDPYSKKMIEVADKALYRSKENGKNKVSIIEGKKFA